MIEAVAVKRLTVNVAVTMPSASAFRLARQNTMRTVWGDNRTNRCVEVVVAYIFKPHIQDFLFASCYVTFMSVRRMCFIDPAFAGKLNSIIAQDQLDPNNLKVGLIANLHKMCHYIGVSIDEHLFIYRNGVPILPLLHPTKSWIEHTIRTLCRDASFTALAKRTIPLCADSEGSQPAPLSLLGGFRTTCIIRLTRIL